MMLDFFSFFSRSLDEVWSRSDRGVHSQGEIKEISGMALSPFMFAMLMGRLTDEVRQEFLWNVMFADDKAI